MYVTEHLASLPDRVLQTILADCTDGSQPISNWRQATKRLKGQAQSNKKPCNQLEGRPINKEGKEM